jgi:DNA-binding CsgD family transcriptional regulator
MKRTSQLENYLRSGRNPAFLVDAPNGRILMANSATSRAYAYRRGELAGLSVGRLWPAASYALSRGSAQQMRISRHRRSDGSAMDVQVTLTRPRRGPAGLTHVAVREVSERAFSLALVESQSHVLDRLARGAPLSEVLRALVEAVEALSGDMLGSVLLLREDGRRVVHGAAPNLPAPYWKAINGLQIGPSAGSCGTAMYSGRQVIVEDVETDPLWQSYRRLALAHGLRACWSTPILSLRGAVRGAFALYYREPRRPGVREQQLVQVAVQLAAIAIERHDPYARAAGREAAHRALSARELEVARLIARGERVKRIASALGISLSTAYTHRARVFEKLGVDSDVAVAQYVTVQGLLA